MRYSLETVAPLLQAPFESRLGRALVSRQLIPTRLQVYRGDSLHPMRTHRRDAAHDGFVKRLPWGNKLRAGTASGDETRPAGRFTRAMSLSDEYWEAGYEYSDTARDDAIGSVLAVGCDDRAVGCDEAAAASSSCLAAA